MLKLLRRLWSRRSKPCCEIEQTSISEFCGTALELSHYSQRVAKKLEVFSEVAAVCSRTSEHVNAQVQTSAKALSEFSGDLEGAQVDINGIIQKTNEIEANANQVATFSGMAENVAQSASTNINDLINSVSAISQFLQAIDQITSQTKLLALNAQIEAARAGEVGKSFAVVAKEVRNLAETCSKTSNQMRATFGSLEKHATSVTDSTTQTIEITKIVTGVCNEIASAVEAQMKLSKSVVDRIDLYNSLSRVAGLGVEESRKGVEELWVIFGLISSMLKETHAVASESKLEADDLGGKIYALYEEVLGTGVPTKA